MEKRLYQRVFTDNIETRYFCGNTMYTGTITNLSENGMFINTMICFPFESQFEVFVRSTNGMLKVPVRVNRIVKTEDVYNGMGVEVINPPVGYLELLRKLRGV